MVYLRAFGSYLPSRVVSNEEIGALVDTRAEWIFNVSGIEERRFAAAGETVADLATRAAEDCLARAGVAASTLGIVLVASGSVERLFPGPAVSVANRLGLDSTPALDLPLPSSGSLVGMALAHRLAPAYGNILVIGAEKMSSVVMREPRNRNVSVLFGDGAGACLVSPDAGNAKIVDATLHSDGAFAEDLRLEFDRPLEMNGRSVILQASRKIPRVVAALLERNGRAPADVDVFLMHQANQNLTVRVAEALGVSPDKFYTNIRTRGNTSSASMLIAAAEWSQQRGFRAGVPVVFGAFGAGFQWGALLAEGC